MIIIQDGDEMLCISPSTVLIMLVLRITLKSKNFIIYGNSKDNDDKFDSKARCISIFVFDEREV